MPTTITTAKKMSNGLKKSTSFFINHERLPGGWLEVTVNPEFRFVQQKKSR